MKRLLLIAILPAALVTASSGDARADNSLTKSFWKYSTNKYRRAGAEGAFLGSAGIVRKKFGKAYSYERKESLPKKFLRKKVGVKKVVRVKGSQIRKFDHKGMFKYLTFSSKDTVKKLRQDKLELVKFELEQGQLKRAINAETKFLKRIRGINPKGKIRVVTAVWLVVDAKTFKKFRANVKGKLNIYGATVKGDDTASSQSTWTINKGAIIAYEFAKVKWSKGGKISDFKVDRPNM